MESIDFLRISISAQSEKDALAELMSDLRQALAVLHVNQTEGNGCNNEMEL